VTCDQLSDDSFSLHWLNDWHWLEQNGSVTFLTDGSSAGNWTEWVMAQNFNWYELIPSDGWNTSKQLTQFVCVCPLLSKRHVWAVCINNKLLQILGVIKQFYENVLLASHSWIICIFTCLVASINRGEKWRKKNILFLYLWFI
jgi:hypothetical protein